MTKDNYNIDYDKSLKILNNNTMKVTIKRVIVLSQDPCFQVYKGNELIRVFSYKADAPEGNIYNEAINLTQAKELAAKLELCAIATEEIVYETPDPDDIPPGLFNQNQR